MFHVGDRVDLGADEAALKVGMDDTGGFRSGGSLGHGPGADLLLAGGVEGLLSEQFVGGTCQLGQCRFIHAVVGEHLDAIGFIEIREFLFDPCADGHRLTAAFSGQFSHRFGHGSFTECVVVGDIHDEHLFLGGDESQSFEYTGCTRIGSKIDLSSGAAFRQYRL